MKRSLIVRAPQTFNTNQNYPDSKSAYTQFRCSWSQWIPGPSLVKKPSQMHWCPALPRPLSFSVTQHPIHGKHGKVRCADGLRLQEHLSVLWMAPAKSLWTSYHHAWVPFKTCWRSGLCPHWATSTYMEEEEIRILVPLSGDSKPICRQTGHCLPLTYSRVSL